MLQWSVAKNGGHDMDMNILWLVAGLVALATHWLTQAHRIGVRRAAETH